jgi:hypothetical protein
LLLLTQLYPALRLLRPITLTLRLDQLQLIKLSPTLSQLLRLLSQRRVVLPRQHLVELLLGHLHGLFGLLIGRLGRL